MTRVAAIQMTSGADVARNLANAERAAAAGAGARRSRRRAAREFCVHGPQRGRQARDQRSAGRRSDPVVPGGHRARIQVCGSSAARSRCGCPTSRASPRPASSTTTRVAPSRATTRSTCSTWTCLAAAESLPRVEFRAARRRRSCVDTPAGPARPRRLLRPALSRSCSANCWPRAPNGSACRRPSRLPTGRAHWEVLLRARAIENLCHMVAPAQSGFHENGRETHGDSMIVDPWGRILARLPRGTGVVTAELDFARQREVRQNFPAVSHRRLLPQRDHRQRHHETEHSRRRMFAPQPAALAAALGQRDPLDVARTALLAPGTNSTRIALPTCSAT